MCYKARTTKIRLLSRYFGDAGPPVAHAPAVDTTKRLPAATHQRHPAGSEPHGHLRVILRTDGTVRCVLGPRGSRDAARPRKAINWPAARLPRSARDAPHAHRRRPRRQRLPRLRARRVNPRGRPALGCPGGPGGRAAALPRREARPVRPRAARGAAEPARDRGRLPRRGHFQCRRRENGRGGGRRRVPSRGGRLGAGGKRLRSGPESQRAGHRERVRGAFRGGQGGEQGEGGVHFLGGNVFGGRRGAGVGNQGLAVGRRAAEAAKHIRLPKGRHGAPPHRPLPPRRARRRHRAAAHRLRPPWAAQRGGELLRLGDRAGAADGEEGAVPRSQGRDRGDEDLDLQPVGGGGVVALGRRRGYLGPGLGSLPLGHPARHLRQRRRDAGCRRSSQAGRQSAGGFRAGRRGDGHRAELASRLPHRTRQGPRVRPDGGGDRGGGAGVPGERGRGDAAGQGGVMNGRTG